MANSSSTIRKVKAGSVIKFDDGTTPYILVEKKDGGLSWSPGLYEVMRRHDRGALKTPHEGNARPTKFEIEIFYTGFGTAGDIGKMLSNRGLAGLVRLFTISLWIPDDKLNTSGELIVFPSSYVVEDGLKVNEGGTDYDTLKVMMESNAALPTITTAQPAPTAP